MTKVTLEDYLKQRDAGSAKESFIETSTAEELVSGKPKEKEEALAKTGQPMDASFRDEGEYKKMLDFLRGKNNVKTPSAPPPGVPKKWFVVDESSRGFWVNGDWSQDESLASEALFDSEKAAKELARVVGGVVVPAEEILN